MTDAIANAIVDKDLKQLSRGASLDMSSSAIMRRLEIVDELRELTIALAQAKKLGRSCKDSQLLQPLQQECHSQLARDPMASDEASLPNPESRV